MMVRVQCLRKPSCPEPKRSTSSIRASGRPEIRAMPSPTLITRPISPARVRVDGRRPRGCAPVSSQCARMRVMADVVLQRAGDLLQVLAPGIAQSRHGAKRVRCRRSASGRCGTRVQACHRPDAASMLRHSACDAGSSGPALRTSSGGIRSNARRRMQWRACRPDPSRKASVRHRTSVARAAAAACNRHREVRRPGARATRAWPVGRARSLVAASARVRRDSPVALVAARRRARLRLDARAAATMRSPSSAAPARCCATMPRLRAAAFARTASASASSASAALPRAAMIASNGPEQEARQQPDQDQDVYCLQAKCPADRYALPRRMGWRTAAAAP